MENSPFARGTGRHCERLPRVAPASTWVFLALIVLLPPLSVMGAVVAAGRMSVGAGIPKFAVWVAYGLTGLAGLVIAGGLVSGVITAIAPARLDDGSDVSQRARFLAEGISEAMNCSALGLIVAVVGIVWAVFWNWRGRPRRKS
jgi:hypothetical protein